MNEISTRVPAQPRFRLDDHRQVSRMKSDSERILVHSIRNNRVDFDDAQFQTSNVLISVRESGLNLRAVNARLIQLAIE